MAIVIVDTSPLQYLFQLGLLDLLRELYGTVLIPEAVRDELLVGRSRGVNVPDPTGLLWITLRPTTTHVRVEALDNLGAGERAALALALESSDAIVILDDAAARAAAALNIPVTGTIGVLLLAKERGLVTSIADALSELEQRGFRIAPALLMRVLAIAGEDNK